jgi:uncharacterized membrane protein
LPSILSFHLLKNKAMESLTIIHKINIAVHVAAGSSALIGGLIAIIAGKGKRLHRLAGRIFLMLMSVVIITGLIGVFVFGRNTFLLVISAKSAGGNAQFRYEPA